MRALGVDFGGKRIGIAVGETGTGVVTPRTFIVASGTLARDAQAIKLVYEKERADVVVLGLPLDAEGETRMSSVCRKLADQMRSLGMEVSLVDESFTSAEAELEMASSGLKGSERRKRSDGEAACRIVERFFELQD